MSLCARCGQCWRVCPQQAIEFQHFLKSAWDEVVTLELVRCGVCGEPLYTVPFKTNGDGMPQSGSRSLLP